MKATKKIPFEHARNNVYWVTSDACNYRCHYCFTQSKQASITDPLSVMDGFEKGLKGDWDFILSGGEPFKLRDFFKIIERLVALKQLHRIIIYTNFSVSSEKIVRFLKLTEGKLAMFFASLHLDHVSPDKFLEKILSVERSFSGFQNRLLVNLTTAAEDLSFLEETKKSFFEKGVQLLITPQRQANLNFLKYSVKQKDFLRHLNKKYNLSRFKRFSEAFGDYGLDNSAINFKGRRCNAGCRSIFVTPHGQAYSCVAANRAKKNLLGDLLGDDFKLNKSAMECPFGVSCVPAWYDQYYWRQNNKK